jgi:nicotinamide mononucleotide (NMN) deamidase PncC
MTFSHASLDLARRLLGACERRGWQLATAESCTGGLIVACLTEIPGSSCVVARGYALRQLRQGGDAARRQHRSSGSAP